MPRYIDADALKELIDGGFDIDFDEVPETKKALLNMIDYQETADVVKVVRCKDCKFWKKRYGLCEKLSNTYVPFVLMDGDDFCSCGVKRK